jgi:hypothetical protein
MKPGAVHALLVTAPLELREQLRGLALRELVARCARLRPGDTPDGPIAITKYTLRRLARRFQQLDEEAGELKAQMRRLVRRLAPALLAEQGVNTITASALLVAAGDNPERLRSEGSFAHLCGVAPLDASSGKQQRHRLKRGGDRQANSALHAVAIVRDRSGRRAARHVGDCPLGLHPQPLPPDTAAVPSEPGRLIVRLRGCVAVGVRPRDGRDHHCLDPRVGYQLLGQIVRLSFDVK